MKKMLMIAFAFIVIVGTVPCAHAVEFDMAQRSCVEFIENVDDITYTLFWIDGFSSALSENTIVSTDWMTKLSTHMVTYCQQYPNHTIMQAMEALSE
ncbi:MAG: HdeA/HdeB family chaperone [Pseudomonadota bacterium]